MSPHSGKLGSNQPDLYVPFDSNRFSNGDHSSLYNSPTTRKRHGSPIDPKHSKKSLGRRSRRSKPTVESPISPIPDDRMKSNYHHERYDWLSSRANKSSAGSNHTSAAKGRSCHYDPKVHRRKCQGPTPPVDNSLHLVTDDENGDDADWSFKFPLTTSQFVNPFKHKRGRLKSSNATAKVAKRKRNKPSLATYKQQMVPYEHVIEPGDEPIMAMIMEPVLVAVTIQPAIIDEDAELEKLVESSDADLEDIVRFGSLCSVLIPDYCLSTGISTADVFGDNPADMDCSPDDDTITTGNILSKINCPDHVVFYDEPRAQMDGGAKTTVTNMLALLHDVRFFNNKFRCRMRMHGATSKDVITPQALGYLRVRSLTRDGFINVLCYYSPRFTTTLLSQVSVIEATGVPRQYKSQDMRLFFAPDEEVLDRDLLSNKVNLEDTEYNHNYGTCMLTCVHRKKHNRSISIPGIIRSGLCFTQPLILPSLDKEDPRATIYNSIDKAKEHDPKFRKKIKSQALEMIYNYQQDKHIELMSALESLPEEYHSLPFHTYLAKTIPINAINMEAEAMLWHQRLVHCGPHSMKRIHDQVDGVPDLSKFEFDAILKCPTCLKTNLTKSSAGFHSLRDTVERPYQGLFCDMAFSGQIRKDKDGKVIESSREDVEGLNGETAWILIADAQTRMLHGDTRLSKASPVKWFEAFLQQYSPECQNKWVVMDQGGELYNNPEVRTLFKRYNYEIYPTGADSSNQNGPVERSHRTVSNGIKSCLIGAGLPASFWPFAFLHVVRIQNALPGNGQKDSPILMSTGNKDNLKNLRTFGCRVWV